MDKFVAAFSRRPSEISTTSGITLVSSNDRGSGSGSGGPLTSSDPEKEKNGREQQQHQHQHFSISTSPLNYPNDSSVIFPISSSSSNNSSHDQLDLRAVRPDGTSNFKTFASLVCVIAGSGSLALPHTFAVAGWMSAVLIVLCLFMSVYSGNLTIECLYLQTDRRRDTYQQVARAALGQWGYYFCYFVSVLNLFGTVVLYFILSSTLIRDIIFHYSGTSVSIYLLITLCGTFVWVCLIATKSLREVALFSILGALATFGVVGIVVGVSLNSLIHHTLTVAAEHQLVNWSKLPIALATISFAYGGNVVYPHCEQAMKTPKSWKQTLWQAQFTCFIMYMLIGVVGYTVYGSMVSSPILTNLPHGILSVLANLLISAHVLLTAPILLTSLAMMCEESIGEKFPVYQLAVSQTSLRGVLFRAMDRTVIVIAVGVVAAVLPYFGDVLDLLGSMTSMLLIFIFPVLFTWKLGGFKGKTILVKIWAAFVFLISVIVMVLGTVDAVKHLVEDIQNS